MKSIADLAEHIKYLDKNETDATAFSENTFFLLDFGLSRLTSLQFSQYIVAGFFKPTIPQSPPSYLRDYSICNNARF